MRSLGPSLIAALIPLITFSLAVPAPDPSTIASSHSHPDGPAVDAGMYVEQTRSHSHSYEELQILIIAFSIAAVSRLKALKARATDLVTIRPLWPPSSAVRIVMEVGFPVAGNAVKSLLEVACYDLYYHVQQGGDGLLEHGFFQLNGENNAVSLLAWNANNHQTTVCSTCALSLMVVRKLASPSLRVL